MFYFARFFILLVLVSIFCSSCVNKYTRRNEEQKVLRVVKSEKPMLHDTLFFKSAKLIPLETTTDCLIRKIDKIYVVDDKMIIFDDRLDAVYLFDTKGNFITRIGARGQGPKEYIQITDIYVDAEKKEILLLCDIPYKIMFFNLDGKFIREFNTKKYYEGFSQIGDTILCVPSEYEEKRNIDIYTVSGEFQETMWVDSDIQTYRMDNQSTTYSFSSGSTMSGFRDEVLFTYSYVPYIYAYRNGNITIKYQLDFGDLWIPTNLLNKRTPANELQQICMKEGYKIVLENMMETSDYLLLNTNNSFIVYDKATNRCTEYFSIIHSETGIGMPHFIPVPNSNYIAQTIEASRLLMTLENRKKVNEQRGIATTFDIEKYGIKTDDNPLVILYELP
ncbi:MAG: 6-bladed beta-propeller [Bacteroides sp.]|nr:6-bladed beta-propeller [Bacteroides sp.]